MKIKSTIPGVNLKRAKATVVNLCSLDDIKFVPAIFFNGGGNDDEPTMIEDGNGDIIELDSQPEALEIAENWLEDMREKQ